MEDNAENMADFCRRVTCYLAGSISKSELELVNHDLVSDPGKRAVFGQFCLLQAALVREGKAQRTARDMLARKSGESFFAGGDEELWCDIEAESSAVEKSTPGSISLEDAAILPALTDDADEDAPESIPMPAPLPSAHPTRKNRWWWTGFSGAAVLLVALLTWIIIRSSQPVPVQTVAQKPVESANFATVTSSAAAASDRGELINPGSVIGAGGSLQVQTGAVELTLARGATVLVTAPANVQVIDGNSVRLSTGTIVARVPLQAHGFKLTAPGMSVVDLGTEFGLRVDDTGTGCYLCVLNGTVRATSLDSQMQEVGDALVLTADHAVRHSQNDPASPQASESDATVFTRTIEDVRLPIPTRGTGVGIEVNTPDPAWQVIAVPNDPQWKPKPVFRLLALLPNYTSNTADANWVSLDAASTDVLPGDYVFENNVNLSGFDPATVSSSMSVAVDDYIKAVKVNGVLAEFTTDDVASHYAAKRTLTFVSRAWQPGVNKVDVVVTNRDDGAASGRNPMSLQLSWLLTARPTIKR